MLSVSHITTRSGVTSTGSSGGMPAVPANIGSPPLIGVGGASRVALLGSRSSATPVLRAPFDVSACTSSGIC